MKPSLWIMACLLPGTVSAAELAPWASNRHPGDVPRKHVQEISGRQFQYTVLKGGTMDGRNCRSPQGVWTPFEQTWESNRSVRMENVGQTDVVNPWLSNGRNDFRSLQEIVARAIEPGMSDKEKAIALWWQQVQYRFHFHGNNHELSNPVKIFNVYGHNTCGNDSVALAGQWRTAGLRVAPARLVGHCVTQVYFGERWNLFDGDMQSVFLLRDNETIAGEQDLVRDHDLIKRTHTQGILRRADRSGDERHASIYVFEGEVTGNRDSDRRTAMNMTLRPGEALVWRWGHTAMNMTLRPGEALVWRWGHLTPPKYHGAPEHRFPERICNGLWEYRPDLASGNSTWRQGADRVEGVRSTANGLAAEDGKTGVIVWTVRAPYVFVGGRLEIDGTGAKFEFSADGTTWEDAGSDLDRFFPAVGTARYAYHLRCTLAGEARLRKLGITNDLQMAPLALPEMGIGTNTFTYTDQAAGERRVRITHEWVERSASGPPAAPAEPIFPPDGADVEGTSLVFRWKPAIDSGGGRSADYHFELSARPDMKWPLSMSFARLISRTPDAGAARYTLPEPGQLNPDREYYWRVRARGEHGIWGPWSQVWRFTPRGPAYPLDVALEYDPRSNLGILKWKPNPTGRRPVVYRVYASDEKGFSVSDEPYRVNRGISTEVPEVFPASFLAETQATELPVLGPGVTLAGANKAFYRVVAVDSAGNRSGPSDYVEAPRPVIYSQPVVKARRGEELACQVAVVRSIGDLRMRQVTGREVANFWDIERPRFRVEQGPPWLKIDESTGRLSGIPDAPGTTEAIVSVTLERELRRLDEEILKWGNEKVLATGTETVGSSSQTLVVQVAP